MACGSWDIGCSPVLGDQSGGSTYRLRLRSACSVANKRLSVEFDARCKGPPGGCNFWGSKVTPKRTHDEVGDLWLGREIFGSFLCLGWWQWCFFFSFVGWVGGMRQIMRRWQDDGDGDADAAAAAGEGDGNDQVIYSDTKLKLKVVVDCHY